MNTIAMHNIKPNPIYTLSYFYLQAYGTTNLLVNSINLFSQFMIILFSKKKISKLCSLNKTNSSNLNRKPQKISRNRPINHAVPILLMSHLIF
jgi:hypothetical protein